MMQYFAKDDFKSEIPNQFSGIDSPLRATCPKLFLGQNKSNVADLVAGEPWTGRTGPLNRD